MFCALASISEQSVDGALAVDDERRCCCGRDPRRDRRRDPFAVESQMTRHGIGRVAAAAGPRVATRGDHHSESGRRGVIDANAKPSRTRADGIGCIRYPPVVAARGP